MTPTGKRPRLPNWHLPTTEQFRNYPQTCYSTSKEVRILVRSICGRKLSISQMAYIILGCCNQNDTTKMWMLTQARILLY